MRQRIPALKYALSCVFCVLTGGCQLPDFSVRPRYVPSGETLGSGAERTIALNVRDSRQHRNKSTPSGAEILAAGGKGKVLLKESYADIVADGLRTAFEA